MLEKGSVMFNRINKIALNKNSLFGVLLMAVFVLFTSCNAGPASLGGSESNTTVDVASGATGVSVNKAFTVTFSAPTNASTVNTGTFFVVPNSSISADEVLGGAAVKSIINNTICNPSNAVAAVITASTSDSCNTTFTLTPSSSLDAETNYALCATTSIEFCNPNLYGYFAGIMNTFKTGTGTTTTYSVGGTITGLSGTVLLQNNSTDNLEISAVGAFTFATNLSNGAAYAVTVMSQPSGQTCSVSNGRGTISSANVTNVSVVCSVDTYSVGGTVTGLSGTVVLQNNSADDLSIRANGSFTFVTEVADGAGYAVTVITQPSGQACTVSNSSGTISSANVTNISVTCSTNAWALSVSNLETGSSGFEETVTDADNNIYAVGNIVGILTYDFGSEITLTGSTAMVGNVALVKYTSSGTPLWARTVTGGGAASYFVDVATDSNGNVFAVGYINGTGTYTFGTDVTAAGDDSDSNLVIVKYNSSGTALWAKSVDGSDESRFQGVATDSTGNVYAVGWLFGSGDFTFKADDPTVVVTPPFATGYNMVIVKYNTNGVAQWAITDTGGGGDGAAAAFSEISIDSSDNIYAVGYINGILAFGVGYDELGETVEVTGAYEDGNSVLLAKYNTSGNAIWAKSVTSAPNASNYYGVTNDLSGNIYTAGVINGTGAYTFDEAGDITATGVVDGDNNIVIAKYNSSGAPQWARSLTGGGGGSYFNDISADSDGNTYAVGFFSGTSTMTFAEGVSVTGTFDDSNMLIVKYNSSGAAQSARTSTGSEGAGGDNSYSGVVVDSDGYAYVVGTIGEGTYTFAEDITATGIGMFNLVIVKYID